MVFVDESAFVELVEFLEAGLNVALSLPLHYAEESFVAFGVSGGVLKKARRHARGQESAPTTSTSSPRRGDFP